MAEADYRPDFFARSGPRLRCRICLVVTDFSEAPRVESYLAGHEGAALACPGCGLASRIPSLDEAEWPERKDVGDPVRGVPMTERATQGHP